MPQLPLVSIVMCTYNGEQYLNEQIQSILNQDYANIEVIVVDDVSSDNTWNLLLEWQHQSPVIKIFRNELNLGYNKNFEKAIQLATGEFVSLADQDDIWLPQKLSRTVAAFTNPDIVLAHSKSVRLENGQLKYHKANLHYHFKGSDTRKLFFFNQVMGHDMVFRRELVHRIVPVPVGMSYDWWIAVMATCYGSIAAVDEYLAHHRIHDTNNFFNSGATSKKKELDLEDTLRLFRHIPALGGEKKKYLDDFLEVLTRHNLNKSGSFDPKLFSFLYKHRKIIFGHKRRFIPELSYIKNAIKYAKLDYRGKGISI